MSKELQVMTSELQVRLDQPLELSVHDVLAQVEKIETIMRKVMKEGIHYGVIPGTEKPTLLKPGAEKLALAFRFRPASGIQWRDLLQEHRECEIVLKLIHFPTDQIVGEGVGSCSTMEKKYRYRLAEPESTGKLVLPLYWKIRRTNPAKAQELLGKEMLARKIDGQWFICKKSSEKVSNPDLPDLYNTILKMAKKRALVDAIMTATAASDVFNREDPDEEEMFDERPRQPQTSSQKPEGTAPLGDPSSFKQSLRDTLLDHCNQDKRSAREILQSLTGKNSIEELSEDQAKDAIADFEEKYGQPVIP